MKREINLITEDLIQGSLDQVKPKWVAGWLIFLVIGMIWLILSREIEIRKVKLETDRMNVNLSRLIKEEEELNQFIQKNGMADPETFQRETIPWTVILPLIGSMVPEGTWLNSLEGGIIKTDKETPAVKEIKLIGFSNSHAPITLLLSRLEREPLFSQIRLVFTKKESSPEDHYVHFEMKGKIN